MNWTEYFINIAEAVSLKSKDRSTKVGAIVVGPDNEIRATGYNNFPRGVWDDVESRHERPTKYIYTVHAEENCIALAALVGVSLKDCTMYLNWEPILCSKCTRIVINAGITTIVGPNKIFPSKGKDWQADFVHSVAMLRERNIRRYIYYAPCDIKEVT